MKFTFLIFLVCVQNDGNMYSNDYFGVMIMSLGGIYMSDGPTYMAW